MTKIGHNFRKNIKNQKVWLVIVVAVHIDLIKLKKKELRQIFYFQTSGWN